MTMVQPAGGGIPIRIDSLQTLENFLNMYDLPALALFREALDNALDENATTIKINYGKTGNDKWISFEDNANGMSKNVFKIYLSISRSTKQQTGQTVGFAGIGAKIYLARGEEVEILTETCTGSESWTSTMYRNKRELLHTNIEKISKRKPGTLYKVLINHTDYMLFQSLAENWCVQYYNEALLNGTKISINGKKIQPWNPAVTKQKNIVVKSQGKKFACKICLLKDNLPNGKKSTEYHIRNHFVLKRKYNLLDEIKPEYKDKVFVSINAEALGSYLKTEKTGFKDGWWKYNSDIDGAVLRELKKFGIVVDPKQKQAVDKKIGEKMAKILKNKFPHLLQDVFGGGMVCGGTGHHGGVSPKKKKPKGGQGSGGGGQKKGLQITAYNDPTDVKEGKINALNNEVGINSGHANYIATEKIDKAARNYHIAKVVILTLVLASSKKTPTTLDEVNQIQADWIRACENEDLFK